MEEFMNAALEEAKQGLTEGGIPIGAVLVRDKKIIGRAHNMRVQKNDPLAHAETECIRSAGRIGSFQKSIMFSTLMPCYYCAGALVQFGIDQLVVGDAVTFRGAPEFLRDHWVSIDEWNWDECIELMETFIKQNPALWQEDIGKL